MTNLLAGRARTYVKFCGVENSREADLAFEAGADIVGAILAESPRRIDLRAAEEIARSAPPKAILVAVVGEDLSVVSRACELGFTLQFAAPIDVHHARRLANGAPFLRVVHVTPFELGVIDPAPSEDEITLFDTAASGRLGGSGIPFAWERIAKCATRRPVFVAGGLNPTNVGKCVRTVRPFAVDVRSGIEADGLKSAAKMRAFVRAVREADASFAA